MVNVIVLVLSCLFVSNSPVMPDIKVDVEISGIKNIKGNIRIAIYSTANEFPSKTDIMDFRVIPVRDGVVRCTFIVNVAGEYAMALVQDMNDNGVMDFNLIGFPKEPYAFSNNPGIWHRAPTFKECAIMVEGDQKIEIKI